MAVNDISLSAGVRSSLLSLKSASSKVKDIQERTATGKWVNSPLDNPTNFFAATALNNSASDVERLYSRISEGISTIQTTRHGLEGVSSLLETMQGLVDAASQNADPLSRQALAKSFDQTYAQLNYLVRDTSYHGTNLISNSSSDPMTVTTNDLTIPITPQGNIEYVVQGKFMGSGYVLAETPGIQPAWIPDDRGEYVTELGNLAAAPNPGIQTDTLKVDPADYENGVFGVTFPGPPLTTKTLYADKQGLQIYHSWVYGGFQTQAGMDAAKADLENAMSIVRGYAAEVGSGSGVVRVRGEFNNTISNIYRTGSDGLTLIDLNEEAANLLMQQTRQQLGSTTLSLASQAAGGVLKLLS